MTTCAVYLAIGIDETGHKSVLGLWLGEHEGAKFWLSVLNHLKIRGVHDVLIEAVDGLKGTRDGISQDDGADLYRAFNTP